MSSSNTVLHIITGLQDGGAEGVMYRLCKHSASTKHVVISLMDEGKYGSLLREAGIEVFCLGMNPGKPSLFKFFRLVSLVRSVCPGVVQTWMYHADLIGGLAARIAGNKNVYWGIRHSTLERGKTKLSTILVARLCASLSFWLPKKIICCANKASRVHEELGYTKDKLCVIHNGCDLTRFSPNENSRQRVREEFGVSESEFLIGCVGRYHPCKDHENLFKALALVKDAGVNFRCLLVGKNVNKANGALVNAIANLGLDESVLLAGSREDVPDVMNAIDIHVLASSSEGFPNVLAEAMACGTPCVTTEVGDALDIVGDVELTCLPSDPDALASLVQRMFLKWFEGPEIWERTKIHCVQKIQRFSVQSMVDAYEACWYGRK
ncbi:glycosyltransferase family 4 protein [Marinobacter nanhaiticus]|uniref:glycosyltransferase family 4 protein n=1 Tax=Marinobacter nanhaiticus TaxID=1305740 RepID=UPI001969CFC5|nr:glycosyltransferase [Marinobacter nanhaiticus]